MAAFWNCWVVLNKPDRKIQDKPRMAMRDLRIVYFMGLITAIGLILVYVFQNFYSDAMYTFSNVFSPIIASVAVLSSYFAMRRYWENFGSLLSKIWLGFTLGMFLWFLGELGWAFYTMVLNVEIPYPSFADIFWLIGYLPLFIALILYIEIIQPAISTRMFFLGAIIVASVSAMTFPPLIMPVLAGAAEQDPITLGISLAYPVLDVALFLGAIIGLLVFTLTRLKGRVGVSWHFINVAILLNVVADMAFSYTAMEGTYYCGHPLDLLFHLGYLLFALAFFVHSKEL